ncbi:MAG: LysM peptidoglycan-binding domain-containing protein [Chloroflexota bacterium]|nr:MAG: LysM peptidoglycan-binding domain-containing protein [Chloroflexota bacterium]
MTEQENSVSTWIRPPGLRLLLEAWRIAFAATILLFLSVLAPLTSVEAQGQTKLVLAFYYAWYDPSSFGPGKTPYQPPQPYYSTDGGVIQRHVSEARSAGIDGFVQSWYGPSANQTESNFQTLLGAASANGFKAAVDFETGSPFFATNGDRANALSTLLSTHAGHPAYLRVDGRPVVFFWANWLLPVGDWAQIREQVDPGHNSIWIAEGSNLDYLSVFDGLHLYNTAWSANPAGTAITWAGRTRAAADTYGGYKYWVGTAMPGFNDSLLGRGQATVVRDRAGGAYYQSSFNGAASSSPDMLIVNSFNEWAEGSNIEPSAEFGSYYLDLTRQLSAGYKSGSIAAVVAQPPPAPEVAQVAGPSATPAESPTTGPSPTPTDTPTPTETPTITPSPTPIASPTPQSDGQIMYVIQPGDTLIGISELFDVPLFEIYSRNDLDESSVITVGQRVILGRAGQVPGRDAGDQFPGAVILADGRVVYELAEGDSLFSVAQKYDLTVDGLLELNDNLDTQSILHVGQQIVVGFRPLPAEIGGSTDQPVQTPTSTMTPAPSATPPPTVPASPTATEQPLATDTPQTVATVVEESQSGDGNSGFLLVLFGIVALLALLGGLFLYLGRAR